MANDDTIAARGGLLPLEFPFGNFRKNYYRLTTSAVAVYLGMPMDLDANGQAVVASAATTNTLSIGPAVGFASDNNGKPGLPVYDLTVGPYMPALTNGYVCIADDPNQLFIMQEGSGGTALTTADIGTQTHWAYRSDSGNNTTGYTTAEIYPAVTGATNGTNGALTVIRLADYTNSDGSWNSLGDYAKWVVRISNHRLGGQNLATTGQ